MARIFSWHIQDESKECFAYLAQSGSSGTYVAGSMVLDDKITNSTTLNKIADVVSGYSETNYRNQFEAMKTKVAQKGFTVQWMDYSYYYDVDGNNLIMLTGIGQIGPQGPQGIQGQKGETGSAGKGRNVMCYCGLDSGITPTTANLIGGKFYPNKWEIEYPTDPSGVCVWQDSNEFGLGKVVWMSNADFPSSTGDSYNEYVTPIVKTDKSGNTYTWAPPMQISGPKGDNGADGDRIEFVYKRCHTRKDPVPARPTGTTEAEAEMQGWTDHPLGLVGDKVNPSENWKIEYMSQHIKDDEGNWGEFTEPIIWASWGEDGNDGDGIEYIFAVTDVYDNDAITRTVPNSGMTLALTNGGELRLADIWQEPEVYDYFTYCGVTKTNDGVTVDPDGRYFYGKTGATDTRHASVYPWTDDPMDVSAEEPYEWVSIRRSKWDVTNEHSFYGPFGDPVLWAHWGKDGEKGNDGTSVDIRGQSDTLGHLLKKLGTNVPQVGFSYAIGEDGKRVYVWMEQDTTFSIGRYPYRPNQMEDNWYEKPDSEIYSNYYYSKDNKNYWFTDCGSFYGEPGENAYVHQKYGTDYTGQTGFDHRIVTVVFPEGPQEVDICFTSRSGETPGKYIATYTDNVFDDRGDLDFYDDKWAKWLGDDGQSFGQEQIFLRCQSLLDLSRYTLTATTNAHGYNVGETYLNATYSDSSFTTNDWVPEGWTDVPLGIVPGTYNFIYVCIRRLVQDGSEYDGTWSYFSVPALYAEAVDSPTFQVEYTKWTGTTKPQLTSANDFTSNGVFDEEGWRANELAKTPSIRWSDTNDADTTWMAQCNGYFENSDETKLVWGDWIVTRCKGYDGKAGNGRNIMAYCSLPPEYKPTIVNVTDGVFYPNKWEISFPRDIVGVNPQGASGPTLYCSWQDSNEPSDPSYMVWMTNADFPNSTGTSANEPVYPIVKYDDTGGTYTWTPPVCITGEKGDNGADGESVEFIYFRTSGDTKPDRPLGEEDPHYQEPDFLPDAYINGQWTGEKWKDHPDGITDEMPFEWMSMRTRGNDGLWTRFSDVSAWSRWGEDGVDGDGVEYIFATGYTANDAQALYSTVPKVGDKLALSGGGELEITQELWQEPEIYDFFTACGVTRTNDGVTVDNVNGKFLYGKTGPDDVLHASIYPWTDDASDVSPEEPFEYVSIRRRKYTTWVEEGKKIEQAIYYEFEEPVMWARWSDDGDEVHTSFAFTVRREGDDISKCTVSGFTSDLVPEKTFSGVSEIQMTWTDSPEPWDEATIAASGAPIIWMTSGIFRKHHNAKTGVNTWSQESNWGPITRMVDTDNFEVMYSPGKPSDPEGHSPFDPNDVETLPTGFTKIGVTIDPTWRIKAIKAGWYDEAEQLPQLATWMATNTGSNNKFSDNGWKYIKIKGEKGDSGATGVSKFKSIVFKKTNSTPTIPTGGSYYYPWPGSVLGTDGWYDSVPAYAYDDSANTQAIVWMSSRTFASEGAQDNSWSTPVKATDTEYIDYEWTDYWTTSAECVNHPPLKQTPRQELEPQYNNNWHDDPINGAIFMAVREVNNGEYVGNWTFSKIKGEAGESPTDMLYLKSLFPCVDASADTATLRGFLGVTSGNTGRVVAFLNGSSAITESSSHGTLMIAAGVDNVAQSPTTAKFRVFEDGTVCAKDAEISGNISATTGSIGGIRISTGGLSSTYFSLTSAGVLTANSATLTNASVSGTITAGNGSIGGINIGPYGGISAYDSLGYGFKFGQDGTISISNKNFEINNEKLLFKDDSGNNVLSVDKTKAYHSLTAFTNTLTGGTTYYGAGQKTLDFGRNVTQHGISAQYTVSTFTPISNAIIVPENTTFKIEVADKGMQVHLIAKKTYQGTDVSLTNKYLNYSIKVVLAKKVGNSYRTVDGGVFYEKYGSAAQTDYVFFSDERKKTYTVGTGEYYLGFDVNTNFMCNATADNNGDVYEWDFFFNYNNGAGQSDKWIYAYPANSGVEIFRNGLAIKNNQDNYLFAAAPDGDEGPNGIIFAIKSGGHGIKFDASSTNWQTF